MKLEATSMPSTFLFSSNISPLSTAKYRTTNSGLFQSTQCITFNRRDVSSPISVIPSSISFPQSQQPFNMDYLKSEFGRHGVSFKELGQSYVVKMILENGSAASLLLPSGLITSYKPKMWHGSTIEVLHTCVSEGETTGGDNGSPIVQGGVSFSLDCMDDEGYSWSPTSWILNDVTGSSQSMIQVELVSRDPEKMVEVKYTVTLKEDALSSEINISNSKSSQLKLKGSILSHLAVSTPEATFAFGLEGSNFYDRQPLNANFCIITPDLGKKKETASGQWWPLKGVFSTKKDGRSSKVETEGEEDDNYKHLTTKMSRIYTCAPRNFTIIDRGRRNSVMVGRKSFEELYIYSPGSSHESYGKYAFICVGQSALLKPIILGSGQQWTGEQQLHNPNL